MIAVSGSSRIAQHQQQGPMPMVESCDDVDVPAQ
jgi:hypothetical protein